MLFHLKKKEKKRLSNFLKELDTVVFITQTGGNGAFLGNYIQQRMNPHLGL